MPERSGHIADWWSMLLAPERAGRLLSGATRPGRFDITIFLAVCAMYSGYGISMGMPRGALPALVSGIKLPFL